MRSPFTPSPRSHVVAVPNENPGSELVHLNLVHHQGRLTRWLPGDGKDGLPRASFCMTESDEPEEPADTAIPADYHTFVRRKSWLDVALEMGEEPGPEVKPF